jgi:hypothetical protein
MRLALLVFVALPALAQEQEVQRALMERDQRTVEFAARVQGVPLGELQRLENIAARQLIEVRRDMLPELRPYERGIAASEHVLRLPPPQLRVPVPMELRPLVVEPLPRP